MVSVPISHEFCHVLCGYREEWPGNKWFEETLCEMASLYALRAMGKAWETDPPYAHWKSYRVSLAKYAQDVIDKREKLTPETLAAFYQKHREELVKEPCNRELNGAMAVVLLDLFEAQPERWESVRWLNSGVAAPRRSGSRPRPPRQPRRPSPLEGDLRRDRCCDRLRLGAVPGHRCTRRALRRRQCRGAPAAAPQIVTVPAGGSGAGDAAVADSGSGDAGGKRRRLSRSRAPRPLRS